MALALENIHYAIREGASSRPLVAGITATFHPGRVTVVMGPSGSGKTTLLCLAGGLLSPDRGTVTLDDKPLPTSENELCAVRRRHFGFVFQESRLLDQLDVFENVFLPGCVIGGGIDMARAKSAALLAGLGLESKRAQRAASLSGGERQRVAIARALVGSPRVLLADEPTAALDWQSASDVLGVIRERTSAEGLATVMVTHDPRVQQYADCSYELRDSALHPQ